MPTFSGKYSNVNTAYSTANHTTSPRPSQYIPRVCLALLNSTWRLGLLTGHCLFAMEISGGPIVRKYSVVQQFHILTDKKLSYRRETARQQPSWRGLSPPVHCTSPFWLHLCVRSNPKPATNVYVKRAVRKAHPKLNRAFKVVQGYPYLCRQEPRAVYCRND